MKSRKTAILNGHTGSYFKEILISVVIPIVIISIVLILIVPPQPSLHNAGHQFPSTSSG